MSIFSGIAKLAKPFIKYIPGIGPVTSDLIGAGFSAIGGSGKQGSSKTNQIQDLSENTTNTTNQTTSNRGTTSSNLADTQAQKYQGANIGIEDPLASLFRYGVMGNLNDEIKRAQNKSVFGDAEKSSFINNLNDLSEKSFQSLSGNLARTGGLNSGAYAQGLSDIETSRFGNLSKFFSELPFQEEQVRSARLQPLLGLATGLAGHGPTSQLTSGTSDAIRNALATGQSTSEGSSSGTTTGSRTTHGTTTGDTTVSGPGVGTGFLGQLGSTIGETDDLFEVFRRKKPSFSGSSAGGIY